MDTGLAEEGRPHGRLPRLVIVATSVVLIIVMAVQPMNQTMMPLPYLSKALPFDRIDYVMLAQRQAHDDRLVEVLVIDRSHHNPVDLPHLAQQLKYESPGSGPLEIGIFTDAEAARGFIRSLDAAGSGAESRESIPGLAATLSRKAGSDVVTLEALFPDGLRLRRQY